MIKWINTEKDRIVSYVSYTVWFKRTYVFGPEFIRLTCYCDDREFLLSQDNCFTLSDTEESDLNLYYMTKDGLSEFHHESGNFYLVWKKEAGLKHAFITSDRRLILFRGFPAQGLFKNMLLGIVAGLQEKDSLYGMHAAVFEYNNKGFALVGPHGSGKSTYVSLLLAKYPSLNLLSDDWSVWHEQNSQIISQAVLLKAYELINYEKSKESNVKILTTIVLPNSSIEHQLIKSTTIFKISVLSKELFGEELVDYIERANFSIPFYNSDTRREFISKLVNSFPILCLNPENNPDVNITALEMFLGWNLK